MLALLLLPQLLWLLQVTLPACGSTKLIGKQVATSEAHGGESRYKCGTGAAVE
jgi:hypothetical protein